MNSHGQQIVFDGVARATPEHVVIHKGDIMGWFLADEWSQYDQWLCMGPATPEYLAAVRAAGVEIRR